MSEIPVLYCFARSGGTLVNQLLGVHPNCFVLSEVNPAESFKSVDYQAVEWLKLVGRSELNWFGALPYGEKIRALRKRATTSGRTLIVRDWVTINFLPHMSSGDGAVASRTLEQSIYLRQHGLEAKPLVITRRAESVFASFRGAFSDHKDIAPEEFAAGYLAYAQAVCTFNRLKLEFLQANPKEALRTILNYFNLCEDEIPRMLTAFSHFDRCTGNNTLAKPVPSSTYSTVKDCASVEPLTGVTDSVQADLAKADDLFGYE